MAKGPTSIPEQNAKRAMQAANFGMDWMRQITEESLNQSRVMFEGFLSAGRKAADSFDQQMSEVRERSMTLATEALSNAFDFAHKATRAREPQELVQLQSEFISQQAQAVAEQSKLLGESISRGANEVTTSRVAEASRRASEPRNPLLWKDERATPGLRRSTSRSPISMLPPLCASQMSLSARVLLWNGGHPPDFKNSGKARRCWFHSC